jgi:putative transposase
VQHVVCRGNDRQLLFNSSSDFEQYIKLLNEARGLFPVYIYNFVLMDNHIHLLVEPKSDGNLAKMMEMVSKAYAKYFNKTYNREGNVFQGRYKSFLIQEERYFFACSHYIDFNPVQATLVADPKDYHWSGYNALATGKEGELYLDEHHIYHDLGTTDQERKISYRALVHNYQGEELNLLERRAGILGDRDFKKRFMKNNG